MNSYNVINYKIRPQKQIERGIMAELVNEFTAIIGTSIDYVGMGSLYFADFVFFNKNCKINRMISIEKMQDNVDNGIDENKLKRFSFNKPLSKIELIGKSVTEAIADIEFKESTFVWFDYDGEFEPSIIEDLDKTIAKMKHTSLIAFSVNAGLSKKYKSKEKEYMQEACQKDYSYYLIDDSGKDSLLIEIDKYSKKTIEICEAYLKDKVIKRNKVKKTNYELMKVCDFKYQDGAKMVTNIYLLVDRSKTETDNLLQRLGKYGEQGTIDLSMDVLTLYEKQSLDRCDNVDSFINDTGLDKKTVDKYFKYSKYIPEYTEIYV